MAVFFNYNGNLLREGTPVAGPASRGLRYGDGLFETMSIREGAIQFKDLHFQRLFAGLEVLKFIIPRQFTELMLEEQIRALCKKNGLSSDARIRLMAFRSNGGLYDPHSFIPDYCIEAFPLDPPGYNSNGLVVDIYRSAYKSCDMLANLKSNNFLPYAMAALWAKEQKLNDAILLNSFGRICDTSIANIFMVSNGKLVTPSLNEGCVAGVMRKWLVQHLPSLGFIIEEREITLQGLQEADELFFTNVIKGIRWVRQCGDKYFTNGLATKIYHALPEIF